MDRSQRARDGRQVLRQARVAADDFFDQQSPARQSDAGRQQALRLVQQRHVATRRGALVARRLVGQVGLCAQTHLALFGQAREQASACYTHVVVGQALVVQPLQWCVGKWQARLLQRAAQAGQQRRIGRDWMGHAWASTGVYGRLRACAGGDENRRCSA